MIAALNAAAYNDADDRENIDPFASISGKRVDDPQNVKGDDDSAEASFETVINYNSKQSGFWSESTPAAVNNHARKSMTRRKSAKRKSHQGMYPQLGLYPDVEEVRGSTPTSSTEEFVKIASDILEEMNSRVAGIIRSVYRNAN